MKVDVIEITYCTTHREVLPAGFKSQWRSRVNGEWVDKTDVCHRYGQIDDIDSDGWVSYDRDKCNLVTATVAIPIDPWGPPSPCKTCKGSGTVGGTTWQANDLPSACPSCTALMPRRKGRIVDPTAP